jgi:DNA-binding NarL/FixJ family response regulator
MAAQTLLPIQPATTTRSITTGPHIPIRVFLWSDHRLLREGLARALKNEADILLVGAQQSSLNITSEIIKSTCDVLLVDPVNTSAFDCQVLDELERAFSNLRVVMIEMEATIAEIISTILSGSPSYRDLGHAGGPG